MFKNFMWFRYPLLLWISIFGGLLGSFQNGYQVGVLNTSLQQVLQQYGIWDIESPLSSLLVTWLLIGGAIGSFIAGALGDIIGPKSALLCSNVVAIIGALISAPSQSYWQLSVGRLLLGLSAGAFSSLSMWYIADISPLEVRGAAGTMNQIFTNIGILCAYLMGLRYRSSDVYVDWWRIMQAVALIPALIMVIILVFSPESFVWLKHKRKHVKADNSQQRLWGGNEDQFDYKELDDEQQLTQFSDTQQESQFQKLKLVFAKKYRRVVVLSVGVLIFIQLSGVNTVILYSKDVLRLVGFQDPVLGTILTGVLNLLATFLATFVIDKVGRKPLMVIGYAGMSICFLGMALSEALNWSSWFLFVFMMVYIVLFGLGVGSVTVLYSIEILPLDIKGWTQTIGFSLNWICVIGLGFLFPLLLSWVGNFGTFILLCLLCFLGLLFVSILMVETKKLSLSEILMLLVPSQEQQSF